jgi:putative membrane protein
VLEDAWGARHRSARQRTLSPGVRYPGQDDARSRFRLALLSAGEIIMSETAATPEASHAPQAGSGPAPNLSLISTQLSWQRSELSNLRTLLAWARTSVSMIGFGFTIYNFYRGFLEDLASAGRADGARNLGLALVTTGTLAMLVAVWNYWMVNRSLTRLHAPLEIPDEFKQRWMYAYLVSAVLFLIGLITLVFMLRMI